MSVDDECVGRFSIEGSYNNDSSQELRKNQRDSDYSDEWIMNGKNIPFNAIPSSVKNDNDEEMASCSFFKKNDSENSGQSDITVKGFVSQAVESGEALDEDVINSIQDVCDSHHQARRSLEFNVQAECRRELFFRKK
jgi:hypothetical protein